MRIPTRDISFALYDVLDYESHYAQLGLTDSVTRELLDAILEECAKFSETELQPLNRIGDEHGCQLKDGEVTTPPGFKAAYQTYVEGGWPAICGDPEHGGQGLPHSVGVLTEEILCTANMAWTMYPGLSHSAVAAVQSHGSNQQKTDFLEHLVSGNWTGTMCLTEPHCGSDVGLAKTKAELRADGSYSITGTKIFISAGEHDLAENIVHLVLARTPDAPSGTRGISLFLVPKFDLDGRRNDLVCGALEEKMGIHGNSTCVMHFEAARGYLVGEENGGMRCMFTMMNSARIGVGIQGLAVAEAAYQASLDYANDRLQMRSLTGPKAPDKPADPIIVHPDVRRMLLTQKAIIEGGRTFAYFAGQLLDTCEHATDATTRDDAEVLLDFLTPIIKGCLTELGYESVNHAVQVFGGHGFIRETGVEQFVRDARITLLYEGTTGIQALDLLGRKIVVTQGKGLMAFLALMQELAVEVEGTVPHLAKELVRLKDEWGSLTLAIGGKAQENADELGAAATDYLMYSGYCVLAYFWALIAHKSFKAGELEAESPSKTEGGQDPYILGKRGTADFYFQRLLPRTAVHKSAVEAGAASLMAMPAAAFGHF